MKPKRTTTMTIKFKSCHVTDPPRAEREHPPDTNTKCHILWPPDHGKHTNSSKIFNGVVVCESI